LVECRADQTSVCGSQGRLLACMHTGRASAGRLLLPSSCKHAARVSACWACFQGRPQSVHTSRHVCMLGMLPRQTTISSCLEKCLRAGRASTGRPQSVHASRQMGPGHARARLHNAGACTRTSV